MQVVRGQTVAYKSRPEFIGLVLDTWEGASGSPSATILWQSGTTTIAKPARDLVPTEQVLSPQAIRAPLSKLLKAKRATVAKVSESAEWIAGLLGAQKPSATPRKGPTPGPSKGRKAGRS